MSAYNYVKHSAPCWKCGADITDWQTKDANRFRMDFVTLDEIDNFYMDCNSCGAWNEFERDATGSFVRAIDHQERWSD